MYVCLCYGITEKNVKGIIKEKKTESLEDFQKHCAAGSDCGCCLSQVEELLKTANS